MRRSALLVAPLAALLVIAPSLTLAQSNVLQQGTGLAPQPIQPTAAIAPVPAVRQVDDRVAFNPTEQWLIPHYFLKVRQKQQRAARNKQYDRALPAGLSQEPAKGDHLSPAILAELHRLPGSLLRDLPPARPGTDRVIVGKNVLMVATADGQVLDILAGIIH